MQELLLRVDEMIRYFPWHLFYPAKRNWLSLFYSHRANARLATLPADHSRHNSSNTAPIHSQARYDTLHLHIRYLKGSAKYGSRLYCCEGILHCQDNLPSTRSCSSTDHVHSFLNPVCAFL